MSAHQLVQDAITDLKNQRTILDTKINALRGCLATFEFHGAAIATVAPVKRGPGRPPKMKPAAAHKPGKRVMSPEGRARIAEAARARWAKVNAAKTQTT